MKRSTRVLLILLSLPVLAGLIYLFWLPYVPKLATENPKTSAILERRALQAQKAGKKHKPQMIWRNLNQISPNLVHAVYLAEDDTFYQHHGFDVEQIKIAIKINWEKKKYAYGGSTITQQLARTLYLSPSKNLLRKAKEAIITVWMERSLPKKRIFEIYLNVVEWGDGIYGAEAAALHYYGKSAAEITADEAVALASILPSPRKWSPHRVTNFMQKRRSNLLSRMKLDGFLTEEEKAAERARILMEVPEEDDFEAPEAPLEETLPRSEPSLREPTTFTPPAVLAPETNVPSATE